MPTLYELQLAQQAEFEALSAKVDVLWDKAFPPAVKPADTPGGIVSKEVLPKATPVGD